jgi:hypothetical protein
VATTAEKAALVLATVFVAGGVNVSSQGKTYDLGLGATVVFGAEKDKPQEIIPAELKGFQGMMKGKLVKKDKTSIVFKVEAIMKVWEGNKAENPKEAVGQTLILNLNKVSDHHRKRIMKNFRGLKEGDQIELEAFDLGEKTLCIKEWLRKVKPKVKRA